ncbi:MAG: ABC transporter substrate-binding protein, partial [Actinomycetota bacterium]
ASYLPADLLSTVEIVGDGADINFEIISAFGADAIVASQYNVDAFGYRDQAEAITRLEAVDVAPLTPWQVTLREIGTAFGVPQRTEARIAEAEMLIADLSASLTDEQRALEVSVIRCRLDNCRYQPGGTSFAGQVLDDLGVARPEVQASDAEGRPTVVVSFEQIDLLSGDVVILFGTDAEDALVTLQDSALWNLIPAVQNGHVFQVDEDAWFFGNVLAAEYVARDMVEILQTVAPG